MNNTSYSSFELISSTFADGGPIPSEYTCDGSSGLSPALSIIGTPTETRSLVLIMDDPDIPQAVKDARGIDVFDHWVLFNIPPGTKEILEGDSVGTPGANSAGQNTYAAPCPPVQYEPSEHRYVFTLYALDEELPLKIGASKHNVLAAVQGHIIAQAQITGRYKRK
ncbi:YbhB/YbcL family Raf kinase inhibitor-like protein [Candidatus Kaiserbacteria bacterium]|nr:YbhB/YbcL family Raf kinase inhibitor-like protein [Candidatus Kaiserbacteria bacterium]